MKKLVIVVGVLVLALLVAPWGVGRLAEKRLNHGLDKLVEAAPYLKVVETQWTGGWFKSEQVVTFEAFGAWMEMMNPKTITDAMKKDAADAEGALETAEPVESGEPAVAAAPDAVPPVGDELPPGELPPEELPAGDAPAPVKMDELMRFTVRNEVLHGPVLGLSGFGIARVNSHLVLSEETQKKITEIFGDKIPLEISTRVGFLGGGTTTFSSEGRTIKPADAKAEFSWETFRLAIGYSSDADKYDVDGKWPKLEVKSLEDKTHFVMKDMTLDGDGNRVRGDLYDGDFTFRIASMSVSGDANQQFEVADLHYIGEVASKDDFTAASAKLGTGAFKSPQFSALGLEIKEIHYDVSVNRLHTETLEKMLAGVKAMYAKPLTSTLEVDKVMFAPLKEQGAELLKFDPELSIDRIGLVTPEGDGYLKGVIRLKGATADDFAQGSMSLVGKIHADLTIDVSEKMIQKFPNGSMAAGGAVDAGYAARKGDRLVCKIVFANGALTINGKPQGIPGLGGPPPEGAAEGIQPAE
jgi:uncharacterized protein YdgA (DUF945 family)